MRRLLLIFALLIPVGIAFPKPQPALADVGCYTNAAGWAAAAAGQLFFYPLCDASGNLRVNNTTGLPYTEIGTTAQSATAQSAVGLAVQNFQNSAQVYALTGGSGGELKVTPCALNGGNCMQVTGNSELKASIFDVINGVETVSNHNQAIAAAGGTTTLRTGTGRFFGVNITTAGTAAISCFDNTAASGTAVLTTPATTVVGQVYPIGIPSGGYQLNTGLTCTDPASGPAMTVSWSQ